MAQKKITELLAATSITPSGVFPFDSGTQTFQLRAEHLASSLKNIMTGVPYWTSTVTYGIGDIVNNGSGQLFISLANSNLNNSVSDATKWRSYVDGGVLSFVNATSTPQVLAPFNIAPTIVNWSTGAANKAITLPAPTTCIGKTYRIQKSDNGTGIIAVGAGSGVIFIGELTSTLNLRRQNDVLEITSAGSLGWIVHQYVCSAVWNTGTISNFKSVPESRNLLFTRTKGGSVEIQLSLSLESSSKTGTTTAPASSGAAFPTDFRPGQNYFVPFPALINTYQSVLLEVKSAGTLTWHGNWVASAVCNLYQCSVRYNMIYEIFG